MFEKNNPIIFARTKIIPVLENDETILGTWIYDIWIQYFTLLILITLVE